MIRHPGKITMQNDLLAELQESEARFRAMFESAGIGIALVGMDRRPLEANTAMIKMTGYSPEEFFQTTGAELSYPGDAEIGLPELKAVLDGKLNTYQIEKRYVRKDGQIYWVKLTNSVVRAPDGQPQYFVTMVEDINEQKQAQEELHKSQARFQAIFNDSAVGMGVMGLDRRIIDANPAICRMYGMTREEMIGMSAAEVTYPEDNPQSTQLLDELIAGKRNSYEIDRRYIRRNGEVFWAHVTMSSVCGRDSKPLYLVGMVIDIDRQMRDALALEESETRFRAMFENSAIGLVLAGLDGLPRMVNPAIVRMTGYSEQELLQLPGMELSYPEDREQSVIPMQELLEGRQTTFQTENRFVRKNGDIYWVRQTISTVCDTDGKPLNLVIMVEDIDEQKKAALALQESEARFRAMFDSAAIGIGMMDLNRRVIRGNLQARGLLGYSEDELKNLDVRENTHPDDRAFDGELFAELVSGKRDSYQVEKRYRHKDGHWVWARSTLSAVRDAGGHPLYILALVEDISEHKQTLAELSQSAERLRESDARFRAMFDNAAVGMAMMTMDRRILQINKATERITGYPLEELMQINPSQLSHPDDRYLDRALFEKLVRGEIDQYNTEKRYIRKNDEIFWGRVTYTSVRNPIGEPEYLIGMIEDITEQKRTTERLAEQEAEYLLNLQQRVEERTHELAETNQRLHKEIEQRLKIEEELAKKAAEEAVTADRTRLARDLHDAVTQTLFSASLTAEVLPDLWEMDVDEAKKSTEELRQLTRGALAEMRTLLLELRPSTLTQTRLGDLIRQLCEAFIGRSRLPITLNIEGDCELPPEVQVAIYRIAQESLNNVFKYARATKVDVNLFLSSSTVRFDVCDNGVGFDMAASKPTSLGMRIMRERAEAIGAEYQITSTPGSGTCVEVTWVAHPNQKLRVL
jgi:PAS domain S-box-containing protein